MPGAPEERARAVEQAASVRQDGLGSPALAPHPLTPDGRYMVVRGRLWRTSNPALEPALRQELVDALMSARRDVRGALKSGEPQALLQARHAVDRAKHGLGERGPPWWTDGEPDLNRRMVAATHYAAWHASLSAPPTSPVATPVRGRRQGGVRAP